jgi:hypothetical protein
VKEILVQNKDRLSDNAEPDEAMPVFIPIIVCSPGIGGIPE